MNLCMRITNKGVIRTTWLSALLVGVFGGVVNAIPTSDLPQTYRSAPGCFASSGTKGDEPAPTPLTLCATPAVDDACLTECTPLSHGMGSYWCATAIYKSLCVYDEVPGCTTHTCTCRVYDNQTCTNPFTPENQDRRGCQ